MDTSSEFAEQYTPRERLKLVLLAIIFCGAFMLAWNRWALPRWTEFVQRSPCFSYAGISGPAWVFYGMFVGLPLFSALVAALLFGRRGARILRDKQVPYVGERVFRPTKIQRGAKARWIGWAHVLAPLMFIAIAVWGLPHAKQLTSSVRVADIDRSTCDTSASGPTR